MAKRDESCGFTMSMIDGFIIFSCRDMHTFKDLV